MGRIATVPPEKERLESVLSTLLPADGAKAFLSVENREVTIEGTFPKEIVTCRLADGSEARLFCKYAAGHEHNAHGHRGGVELETAVYRDLLTPLAVTVPALRGIHKDAARGEIWLVLDFLDDSVRVKKSTDPRSMSMAASWIGSFHARATPENVIEELLAYDTSYYRLWSTRAWNHCSHLKSHYPWLRDVCDRIDDIADVLMGAPPTIIHGEYYAKNILYRDGIIYPVDWESAALASGEIDLASLTEAWPEDWANEMESAYVQARWPNGAPAAFPRVYDAAQVYLQLRWLGDRPESVTQDWRFGLLRRAAARLDLL
jgi:hypothetical protein